MRITGASADPPSRYPATTSTGRAERVWAAPVSGAPSPGTRRRTADPPMISTVAIPMAQTVAVPVDIGPRFMSSLWGAAYICNYGLSGARKDDTGLGGFEPPTSGLEARRYVLAKPQTLWSIPIHFGVSGILTL